MFSKSGSAGLMRQSVGQLSFGGRLRCWWVAAQAELSSKKLELGTLWVAHWYPVPAIDARSIVAKASFKAALSLLRRR